MHRVLSPEYKADLEIERTFRILRRIQKEQRGSSVTVTEGGIFEDFSSNSKGDMADQQQVEPDVGMPEPDIIGIANDRGRS
ncbi:hypothetical protein A2U01_0073528, partial [Trifolium medium]|nr:hypothetical protein [Trifolium medium]